MSEAAPPQWLSTHPSPATRIADLRHYADRVAPLYPRRRAAARFLVVPAVFRRSSPCALRRDGPLRQGVSGGGKACRVAQAPDAVR